MRSSWHWNTSIALSANHNNAPVVRNSRPDIPDNGMSPAGRPSGMGPGGMGRPPMGGMGGPGGRR